MSRTSAVTQFGALCREFLAGEYAAAPVMASGLGLTQFDGQLDDLKHRIERAGELPDPAAAGA